MAKQINKNAATVTVAALKATFEAAEKALNAIVETATLEEKLGVSNVFADAKAVLDAITEASTVEEKEAAQTAFDNATAELERITALPTPEEKQLAQTAYDEAKSAYEVAANTKLVGNPKPAKAKEELVKGKFIVSPTGKYNLAYNVGEEAELPKLQAEELDEAGYFKISK